MKYQKATLQELKNQLTLCQQLINIRNLQIKNLKQEEPDFEKLEKYKENENEIIHHLQFSIKREKEWESKEAPNISDFQIIKNNRKELLNTISTLSETVLKEMTQHKENYKSLLHKASKAVTKINQQIPQIASPTPSFVDIIG